MLRTAHLLECHHLYRWDFYEMRLDKFMCIEYCTWTTVHTDRFFDFPKPICHQTHHHHQRESMERRTFSGGRTPQREIAFRHTALHKSFGALNVCWWWWFSYKRMEWKSVNMWVYCAHCISIVWTATRTTTTTTTATNAYRIETKHFWGNRRNPIVVDCEWYDRAYNWTNRHSIVWVCVLGSSLKAIQGRLRRETN